MTTYVDISVLAAYYCPEPLSILAERTLRRLSSPMISELTLFELTSAILRKIREQALSREEGARILAQIDAHVEEGYYRVMPVQPGDYRVARAWLGQTAGHTRNIGCIASRRRRVCRGLNSDGRQTISDRSTISRDVREAAGHPSPAIIAWPSVDFSPSLSRYALLLYFPFEVSQTADV